MITFTGTKGGVGATTVAASVAILASHVCPIIISSTNVQDLRAVLGRSVVDERIDDILTIESDDDHYRDIHEGNPVAGAENYLVTRLCYLALRGAHTIIAGDYTFKGIVLIEEPGRALRPVDVEKALGLPIVASLSLDPVVARAIDAGLLAARLPRSLSAALSTFIQVPS